MRATVNCTISALQIAVFIKHTNNSDIFSLMSNFSGQHYVDGAV